MRREARYQEVLTRTHKLCRGCGQTLLLSAFGKNNRNSDGKQCRCLKCVTAAQRAYLDRKKAEWEAKNPPVPASDQPQPAIEVNSLWFQLLAKQNGGMTAEAAELLKPLATKAKAKPSPKLNLDKVTWAPADTDNEGGWFTP